MANYTITSTEEGRVTFTVRYNKDEPIRVKAGELLQELTGVAPKPATFTEAQRAEYADKVRVAAAKNALEDFRRRARANTWTTRVAVAKNELEAVASAGFTPTALNAMAYAGWNHSHPTEEAGKLVLAYLEAALDSYPGRPDPYEIGSYAGLGLDR